MKGKTFILSSSRSRRRRSWLNEPSTKVSVVKSLTDAGKIQQSESYIKAFKAFKVLKAFKAFKVSRSEVR